MNVARSARSVGSRRRVGDRLRQHSGVGPHRPAVDDDRPVDPDDGRRSRAPARRSAQRGHRPPTAGHPADQARRAAIVPNDRPTTVSIDRRRSPTPRTATRRTDRRTGRRPARPDDARGEGRPARQRLGVPARRREPRSIWRRPPSCSATASVRSRGSRGEQPCAARRRRRSPTTSSATSSRETRLGIPAIVHEEICSGLMARDSTIFPQAIGLASTWQPELADRPRRRRARADAGDRRPPGLSPVLDICRDPRWGRTEETFGEDPHLVACMGVAFVAACRATTSPTG